MPHNDYSFRDVFGSPNGPIVPTPGILRRLDQQASQSLNGDAGGTWSPFNPIIIGGAGLQANNYWRVRGGVQTGPRAASGGSIIIGNGAWPAYTDPGGTSLSPRTFTRVLPLRDFYVSQDLLGFHNTIGQPYTETPGQLTPQPWTSTSSSHFLLQIPPHLMFDVGNQNTGGANAPTKVILRMRIPLSASSAASVPNKMPGFRLFRIPQGGIYSTTTSEHYYYPVWQASHAYAPSSDQTAANSVVTPTSVNGRLFRCSVGGTSGGSQPAAFATATVGQTVTDGGVTWVCETGPVTTYAHFVTMNRSASSAAWSAGGLAQDIVMIPNANAPWDLKSYSYMVEILDQSGVKCIFHSLRFVWSVSRLFPHY